MLALQHSTLHHPIGPGKVLADENRYISISGCVIIFCPARGLLWVDLNGKQATSRRLRRHRLDQGRPPRQRSCRCPIHSLALPRHVATSLPAAVQYSPAHPTRANQVHRLLDGPAELLARSLANEDHSRHPRRSDGTSIEVPPSALGVQPPPTPKSDTDTDNRQRTNTQASQLTTENVAPSTWQRRTLHRFQTL